MASSVQKGSHIRIEEVVCFKVPLENSILRHILQISRPVILFYAFFVLFVCIAKFWQTNTVSKDFLLDPQGGRSLKLCELSVHCTVRPNTLVLCRVMYVSAYRIWSARLIYFAWSSYRKLVFVQSVNENICLCSTYLTSAQNFCLFQFNNYVEIMMQYV